MAHSLPATGSGSWSASTRRSSSFEHDIGLVREAARRARYRLPGRARQRLCGLARLRQPLLAGALPRGRDGVIRDHHFGEGRYEESERSIQRLLGVERDFVPVAGTGVEAEADWDNLRSPETYLGGERGERRASPDRLQLNEWGLTGEWTTTAEKAVLDRPGGSIAFRFHARDVHLVLSRTGGEPIPFRVLLDGEAPARSHVTTPTSRATVSSMTAASTSSFASTARSANAPPDHVRRAWCRGVCVHVRIIRGAIRRPSAVGRPHRDSRWRSVTSFFTHHGLPLLFAAVAVESFGTRFRERRR